MRKGRRPCKLSGYDLAVFPDRRVHWSLPWMRRDSSWTLLRQLWRPVGRRYLRLMLR
jgi:hypothetical protein